MASLTEEPLRVHDRHMGDTAQAAASPSRAGTACGPKHFPERGVCPAVAVDVREREYPGTWPQLPDRVLDGLAEPSRPKLLANDFDSCPAVVHPNAEKEKAVSPYLNATVLHMNEKRKSRETGMAAHMFNSTPGNIDDFERVDVQNLTRNDGEKRSCSNIADVNATIKQTPLLHSARLVARLVSEGKLPGPANHS
eukprot:TRINITY_DN14052_c0_g1_i1.p1 TRINITY_DN14052_c0_g1~~TRINITY_DN14052_c0_g1_i1.p1  ORF type:complete len:195 (-),score=18.54 TRINITY_DN14052_c0_g1_i1:94-678(-)